MPRGNKDDGFLLPKNFELSPKKVSPLNFAAARFDRDSQPALEHAAAAAAVLLVRAGITTAEVQPTEISGAQPTVDEEDPGDEDDETHCGACSAELAMTDEPCGVCGAVVCARCARSAGDGLPPVCFVCHADDDADDPDDVF